MDTTINIRMTKKEKDKLAAVAREAGLSLSAFLRSAALIEAKRILRAQKPRLVK